MKVVAVVSSASRTYLVEASGYELDQIACPPCTTGGHYNVGSGIDVDSRYARVRKLMEGRGKLDSAISQLRGLADALEPLQAIVTIPNEADYEATGGMTNEQLMA